MPDICICNVERNYLETVQTGKKGMDGVDEYGDGERGHEALAIITIG